MSDKRAPYIFLMVLGIILFFILGFRAGQGVEKTNKETAILMSIPPSASLAPTRKPLSFATVKPAGCGIELLYPEFVTVTEESSQSAKLSENGKTVLAVSCEPWTKLQPTSIPGAPTGIIQNQALALTPEKNGYILFQVKHPSKNILITVNATSELYSYVVRNLRFVK